MWGFAAFIEELLDNPSGSEVTPPTYICSYMCVYDCVYDRVCDRGRHQVALAYLHV